MALAVKPFRQSISVAVNAIIYTRWIVILLKIDFRVFLNYNICTDLNI